MSRGGEGVGHAGPKLVHPLLGKEQDHPVGQGGVGGEGAAGGQEAGAQGVGVVRLGGVEVWAIGDSPNLPGSFKLPGRFSLGESPIRTVSGRGAILCVAASPDGRTVAGGSVNWAVKLWDLDGELPDRTLTGHRGGVTALAP